MKCLLLILFSLLGRAEAANVRVISEGIRATRDVISIATTTTPRVYFSTNAYGGNVSNVGIFTSSNIVVSSNTPQTCVVYASGTLTCTGAITSAGVVLTTNPFSGSGAANQVGFWTGATSLAGSSTFTYLGGNVGIGVATPLDGVHIGTGVMVGIAGSIDGSIHSPGSLGLLIDSNNNQTDAVLQIETNANRISAGTVLMSLAESGIISAVLQPGVRAVSDATEVLANGTALDISFGGTEDYDRGSIHDAVNSSNTITVPTGGGGIWIASCGVAFAASALGKRRLSIVQNSTVKATTSVASDAAGSETMVPQVTDILLAVAGDTFKCRAYQDSGGLLNAGGGVNTTWFAAHKIW